MIWLPKPLLARILKGVALAFTLATAPLLSHAQGIWSEYAMISGTLGVSDSRICIGEASRGDIGCPSFAPTISPTGRINASAGLTVDSVSLTTTGTTWGYLGGVASYLPNLSSNAISATNISATTINGIAVSALGSGSATVILGTSTMEEGWPDAVACTVSATRRIFYKSGGTATLKTYRFSLSPTSTNDAYVQFNGDGTYSAAVGGLEGDCANKSISQLYVDGQAFNFIGNSGAGGAFGDRITSGTTSAVANPTGTIDVSASLRVNGSIQVTGTLQLMSPTAAPACTMSTLGSIATINGRLYHCKM